MVQDPVDAPERYREVEKLEFFVVLGTSLNSALVRLSSEPPKTVDYPLPWTQH